MNFALPKRPPSALPGRDWTRPATCALNNFPVWAPAHPASMSGRLTSRPMTYRAAASLFSGLGDVVPITPPGTRHTKWEALDGAGLDTTRGMSAPFATWKTSNSAYGCPTPRRDHKCDG